MAGKRLSIPTGPSRRERLAPKAPPPQEPLPREVELKLRGTREEVIPEESPKRTIAAGALGIAVVLGIGLAYRYFAAPETEDERAVASASGSAEHADAPIVSRCGPLTGATDFLVGEPPKPIDPDAGVPETADDAPFAAVLGRAVATDRGFAVPVLGDGENGSVMSVVEVDLRGVGVTTRLSRSRGDLEPPVLFADGARVLGAAIEPNASGLALKLFSVEGGHVGWGAELAQPRDESLAVDVAASGDRGIVVWDAVKDEASRVVMASFKRADLGTTTAPRAVSPEGVDADMPRLVPRSGGYFLLYRVRGPELVDDEAPTKKGSSSASGADDIDESRGEKGYVSWVEALRLDENGSPVGGAEQLTPKQGQLTGFDVTGKGDAFTLAWRDDDGPVGSGGGDVHLVHVTTGGPLPATTLSERGEGGAAGFDSPALASAGVPVLLGTWVAVPTLRGHALLAALDRTGGPTQGMRPEPSFGFGEPVAQRSIVAESGADATDVLLVAEPKGRAVNLRLEACVAPRVR